MAADIKLHQLRYFVLVAELKSYHAAAAEAARTQPAISLGIGELEHRLGEALFEQRNKTELTPFGSECYPQAKALLEQYDRVAEHMTLAAGQRIGQIAIACVPSFARQLLAEIVDDFAKRLPDIQINVEDETADHVRERVRNRRVDFGVASLATPDPEIRFEPLLSDQMGLVCRTDHRLAKLDRSAGWSDLKGEQLITNGTARLLQGTPAHEIMARAQFSVSNVISLLALVRAGVGVTTLPRLALAEGNPELCFVPLGDPCIKREVGLLLPERHALSPAAKAFRQCIREHIVTTTS